MRVLLIFLLFVLYAVFARWYFVCEVKGLCKNEQGRPTTLKLLDEEDRIILQGYEEFFFEPSKITPELTNDNNAFLQAVAEYLKNTPEQNLTITGAYRPSEQGIASGRFENLGVARADQVRSLLMRNGIEEKRITLDYAAANEENLTAPLQFRLFVTPGAYDKLAFTFTNMTYSDANFEYKSADFRPGAEFIAYADSVATYLSLNPEKRLTIIGHTDSIGSDAYNDPLGLERAENARKYFLEKLGVKNSITIKTEGKRRPVAPNSTRNGKDNPEGRQKNRRVNFIIE